MPKKPLPNFKSEDDERAFYDAHEEDLEDYFDEPTADQRAKATLILSQLPPLEEALRTAEEATEAYVTPSQPIKLRIPNQDLSLAKKLAACKGIGYQTFLKMLIHEGLVREENKVS